MNFPQDRKYHADHMWALALDNGLVEVGVSDYAQDQLGTVIYVDLPEPGDRAEAGADLGAVESAKSVSDLISPVSGEVAEVNDGLADTPKLINESPYGQGWVARIRPELPGPLDELMDADAYQGSLDN